MNNENEFEIAGYSYRAVEKALSMDRCGYCEFKDGLQCIDDHDIPHCDKDFRIDGINVIFVEKKP